MLTPRTRLPGLDAKEAVDLRRLEHEHVRPGDHATPDADLEQRASARHQRHTAGGARTPTGRTQPQDVARPVERRGTGLAQLGHETREQRLEQALAANEQDVQVPGLRHALPGLGFVRVGVALDDHHLVEAIGEHPSGEQSGQAAADDDGAAAAHVIRHGRPALGSGNTQSAAPPSPAHLTP